MSESDLQEEARDPVTEPAPAVEPPGRRLAEAREAAGLSREEVASKLRLQVKLIAALEENDFAHLPPPTFVIGYLRSYARLLALPVDEIVDAYQQQAPESPGLKLNIEHGVQVRSSDLPVKMVTYLIVAALVVLIGLWWATQHRELPSSQPAAVLDSNGNMALPLPPHAEQPATGEAPPAAESGAAVPGAAETTAGENSDSQPAPDSTPADSQGAPESTPPAAAPPAETKKSPEPAPVKTVQKAPEVPPPPALTADTPQSQLVLKFDAECWTEITDADGRRLVYQLEPADKTVTLYGVAPFKVFLGYAPGVEVTYNGMPFDHRPYHHQDIARFTLGTPEDNHPRSEAN